MKDFLLEHYRQVHHRLTESDRNRDIWLGFYLTLMTGSLGFAFYSDDNTIKFIVLGLLLALGIIVARYITIARAWHSEYTNVLIAIHKAFANEDLDLLKAAREVKKSKKFGRYFNTNGTEFWVFIFMLSILSFELTLLLYQAQNYPSSWPIILRIVSIVIALALPFLFGIKQYKRYLYKRESEFPEKSYCIMIIEDEGK